MYTSVYSTMLICFARENNKKRFTKTSVLLGKIKKFIVVQYPTMIIINVYKFPMPTIQIAIK